MSLRDLQNCNPISPFWPYFIPTGSEVRTLLSKTIVNSSTLLTVGSGELQVIQQMGIPLTANIVFFNCQCIAQTTVSVLPNPTSIKLADIDYSGSTGELSWYYEWNGLVVDNRPNVVCTVYYFLV
jgi:hypothetical protein